MGDISLLIDAYVDDLALLRSWPVPNEFRGRLNDLVSARTHIIHPVPVYDCSDRLIPPALYEDLIRGSLAKFEFYLDHWKFASKGNSSFSPRVQRITVLRPPVRIITPKRKRILLGDLYSEDKDGSPSKKRLF